MKARLIRMAALGAIAGLLGAAPGGAATPPAGSVGPSSPSLSWQGQPYSYSTPDPRFCPPQAVDPINLICDHFTLNVEAAGSVTTTISWPSGENDFDLYVCVLDPAADATVADACTGGREVARSDSASGTSETATFAAPGAGQYEVRVVPLAISTPSAYAGTATYSASAGGPGGGASCSPATVHVVLLGIDVCLGLGLHVG